MFVIQLPNGLYYSPNRGEGVDLKDASIFTDWNTAQFQLMYSGGQILEVVLG